MADAQQIKPVVMPAPGRRESFIARFMLRHVDLQQDRRAMLSAGLMGYALPLAQAALVVGVLDSELWYLLLCAEGAVIAWLAMSQLGRMNVEGKVAGYGIAMINTVVMSIAGIALGSHVLWITGAIVMAAMSWLVVKPTRPRTVRRVWIAVALALLPIAAFCVASRTALERSAAQPDPADRRQSLQLAWAGFCVRGGSGTERALLRLRQAQAAFETGDYAPAFDLAHDGAFDSLGRSRVPATPIGEDLLDSLLRLKAQSLYNKAWGKDGTISMRIEGAPLSPEILGDERVRVRWGW